MSFALDALILLTGWTHVLLAPYTKVEESFNLHATHDVLMYGVGPGGLGNYDHFTFPGAVPRTFIGSVVLAYLSKPVIQFAYVAGFVKSKFDLQVIVRLVLCTLNALGLCLLRRGLSRRFGRLTSFVYTLLTISQFHIPFWMGRTLPNMFALLPVNISTYMLLSRAPHKPYPSPKQVYAAIGILTATAVIIRAELAMLVAPLCLQALMQRQMSFLGLIKVGVITAFASIALTVCVDTYFWRYSTPLWPEFAGIYFNVFQGKSAEWGVSPPLTYFTSYLPKLLLTSLPLSFLGLLIDRRVRLLLMPHVVFVGLMSMLGHKEWRFVVYSVPVWNIGAARGVGWMLSRPKSPPIGRLLFLAASGMILINFVATALTTRASIANYPGGTALTLLNEKYGTNHSITGAGKGKVHVHISNLAAQTGASLFLQTWCEPFYANYSSSPSGLHSFPSSSSSTPWRENWTYDKTESLSIRDLSYSYEVTHMISESSVEELKKEGVGKRWRLVGSVEGFDGWEVDFALLKGKGKGGKGDVGDLVKRVWNMLKMRRKEMLWIYERV